MTRRKAKPAIVDANPVDAHPADAHPADVHHADAGVTPVEPAVTVPEPLAEHVTHHRPDDHPVGDHHADASHAAAVRPDGPRIPNPFGFRQDAVAGVRLLEDRRFKQVQLKFAGKPSDAVRQAVAAAGWRWRAAEEHWTKQIDPERGWQTRAEAEELFARVAAMIRAEKGVGHEHA